MRNITQTYLQQAQAQMSRLKIMAPGTLGSSPEKAQCRMEVLHLTGIMLNGFLRASSSEQQEARRLYSEAYVMT